MKKAKTGSPQGWVSLWDPPMGKGVRRDKRAIYGAYPGGPLSPKAPNRRESGYGGSWSSPSQGYPGKMGIGIGVAFPFFIFSPLRSRLEGRYGGTYSLQCPHTHPLLFPILCFCLLPPPNSGKKLIPETPHVASLMFFKSVFFPSTATLITAGPW